MPMVFDARGPAILSLRILFFIIQSAISAILKLVDKSNIKQGLLYFSAIVMVYKVPLTGAAFRIINVPSASLTLSSVLFLKIASESFKLSSKVGAGASLNLYVVAIVPSSDFLP